MRSKFNLADVLSLIAIIVYGFFVFLSENFLEWGDTNKTIVWTAIVVGLLLLFSFGAKFLKQTKRNFVTCIVFECVFVIALAVTSYLTFPRFGHFLAVTDVRSNIQDELVDNIKNGENMFVAYDNYCTQRTRDYSNLVEDAIDRKSINPSYYKSFGFGNGRDAEHKKTLINDITSQLNGLGEYSELRKNAEKRFKEANNAVMNWQPLTIIEVIDNIDKDINVYYNKLVDLSSDCNMVNETYDDFSYVLNDGNVVKEKMNTYSGYSMLGLILAITLFVFMVLPYIAAKRDYKFPGWNNLMGMVTNKKNSNEL